MVSPYKPYPIAGKEHRAAARPCSYPNSNTPAASCYLQIRPSCRRRGMGVAYTMHKYLSIFPSWRVRWWWGIPSFWWRGWIAYAAAIKPRAEGIIKRLPFAELFLCHFISSVLVTTVVAVFGLRCCCSPSDLSLDVPK
jgi:hypothetical protein